MAVLVRSGLLLKNSLLSTTIRTFSTSVALRLKEIREQKDGSTLIIEGVTVPSPRTELLVRAKNITTTEINTDINEKKCYMCSLGLDVKHTDVLILSQFVRSDGCMLPRRITGLCSRQQKKIGKMVSMAQKAGLMINLTPDNCKRDPKKRWNYKKFNTYFDEKTIFMKKIPDQSDRFKR